MFDKYTVSGKNKVSNRFCPAFSWFGFQRNDWLGKLSSNWWSKTSYHEAQMGFQSDDKEWDYLQTQSSSSCLWLFQSLRYRLLRDLFIYYSHLYYLDAYAHWCKQSENLVWSIVFYFVEKRFSTLWGFLLPIQSWYSWLWWLYACVYMLMVDTLFLNQKVLLLWPDERNLQRNTVLRLVNRHILSYII